MRRTRFMSLFYAALAVAFFLVPAFRQAFELPMTVVLFNGGTKMGELPKAKLEQWARQGEAERDAKAIAFVAMRTENGAEAFRLADEASSMDPSLNWIYLSLAWVNRSGPEGLKVAQKLQALDPQNALGYLQEGEYLRERAKVDWLLLDQREKQTEWRAAMQKAFAAPHYRSYNVERFQLEREFLSARDEATPLRMLRSVASYPIPNLLNIRQYAELLTRKIGKDAENAGKLDDALAQYWIAAHFGERMQMEPGSLIEHLIGIAVQQIGYKALIPVLEKKGQSEPAKTLAAIMPEQEGRLNQLRGRNDIFSRSTNYTWTAFLIYALEALIVVFAAITLVAFAYVNAKIWVRPEKKGRLFAFMTALENYVPVLLFIACAGLYLTYYPYAANFESYMTATGGIRDFEAFIRNTMPIPDIIVGQQLPFGNPLVPYAWYALAATAIASAISWLTHRGEQHKAPESKAMAAGQS